MKHSKTKKKTLQMQHFLWLFITTNYFELFSQPPLKKHDSQALNVEELKLTLSMMEFQQHKRQIKFPYSKRSS